MSKSVKSWRILDLFDGNFTYGKNLFDSTPVGFPTHQALMRHALNHKFN